MWKVYVDDVGMHLI